jgi:signal transduction histidine kinase
MSEGPHSLRRLAGRVSPAQKTVLLWIVTISSVLAVSAILPWLRLPAPAFTIVILAMILVSAWIGGPALGAFIPGLLFTLMVMMRASRQEAGTAVAVTGLQLFHASLMVLLGACVGLSTRNRRKALADLRRHAARLEEQAVRLEEQAAELRRSNQDLEEIAYAASHDLQEPLRAVAGYAQLLQMEYADKLDANARDYVQKTVDGVKRMKSLIQGLRALSQLHRKVELLERVECNAVFHDATANLSVAIEESKASVSAGQLPTVTGNRAHLVQVFQNLIANSIKYRTEAPPVIRVEAHKLQREWHFSVQDNGIGIPPEFQLQVFTAFKRLHTREQYAGMGLGLALCKRIVEQHRGRIWIDSGMKTGSTFLFTLPDAPATDSAAVPMLSAPVRDVPDSSNSLGTRPSNGSPLRVA